ncbi:MAG: hypothetical protein Q8M98_03510 [Candidatus Cloacimonadaceae bacterium]|nr:hypothetical protein [Candidatus Cloacimonadaceae bacterium]
MSTEILLVTSGKHFIGQSRKPWVSIDTAKFVDELEKYGYRVLEKQFHHLGQANPPIANQFIFYTFSQRQHLRAYIKDIMLSLSETNTIIPSLDLLYCHENKGFAELYKKRLGILEPRSWYLSEAEEVDSYPITYPIVLKTTSGSNGKGVYLCKNASVLKKRITALSPGLSLLEKIDLLRRKHLRKYKRFDGYPGFEAKKDAADWMEYMVPGCAFVLQEFIPALDCDYRVIVVRDRFYVMKRLIKGADFRASGTKKFVFEFEVPSGLLDFARSVYEKFSSPFLSIDIGNANGKNYLFEFQALHFGTAAIVRSKGFYQIRDGGWSFVSQSSDLQQTLAYGLHNFILAGKRDHGV